MLVDWIAHRPESEQQSLGIGSLMVRFVYVVTIAIVIAFLSRKYFEERFLSWKDRLSPVQTRAPKAEDSFEIVARPLPE